MDLMLCSWKRTRRRIEELPADLLPCSLPRKQRSILSRKRRRTMNDFHDEVLVEILLRLPLTSGFQCKSASKRWLSLVSVWVRLMHLRLRFSVLLFFSFFLFFSRVLGQILLLRLLFMHYT